MVSGKNNTMAIKYTRPVENHSYLILLIDISTTQGNHDVIKFEIKLPPQVFLNVYLVPRKYTELPVTLCNH